MVAKAHIPFTGGGVNINAKNIFGATPLDLATNPRVREILIEEGAVQHFSGEIHPGVQAVLQNPRLQFLR